MGQQLWAGIDAGKSEHHCMVIDGEGQRVLSRRVANDETVLLELIDAVTTLADGGEVTWAIDLNHGGAALLIALLITAEQRLLYIPSRAVHHASGGYRGDGKTDAKDAAIIADQARMRRDLQPLRPGDEIAVDLRILTARRTDLVADRTRAINRLRAQLLDTSPPWRGPLITATARPPWFCSLAIKPPTICAAPVSPDWKHGCANARPATLLPSQPPRSRPPTPSTSWCPDNRPPPRCRATG